MIKQASRIKWFTIVDIIRIMKKVRAAYGQYDLATILALYNEIAQILLDTLPKAFELAKDNPITGIHDLTDACLTLLDAVTRFMKQRLTDALANFLHLFR